MKKIRISSSSLIVSSSNFWHRFSDEYELDFSEYGNWSGALLSEEMNLVDILVIFSSDLNANMNKDSDSSALFFKLLEGKLCKAKSEVVVAFSSWQPDSLVRRSKYDNSNKEFHYWMNTKLNMLAMKYPLLYKIDLDYELSIEGLRQSFDSRNWYFAHCHLSHSGLRTLSDSIYSLVTSFTKPTSKVLILDCDNTLWGGVIGEDGISGIKLGQDGVGKMFSDFQIVVKRLSKEGVLLALCSKNEEFDVWKVFDEHESTVLSRNDIIISKINWSDKSKNIKAISRELSLDLNSFVFFDDNPVEREKIRKILPMVNTVEPPENILDWPKFLQNLDCFAKSKLIEDDKNKINQYRERAKFVEDSSSSNNEMEYLKSIKLKPRFTNINESNLMRAMQLIGKTNQFNLRTVRHSQSTLFDMINFNNDSVFLMSLVDAYGDHGLIGLAAIKDISSRIVYIDSLLISCRVLGRYIEYELLNEIIRRAKDYGYKYLVSQCLPTERNTPAQDFQKGAPFTKIEKIDLDLTSRERKDLYNYFLKNESIYAIELANYQEKFKEIFNE